MKRSYPLWRNCFSCAREEQSETLMAACLVIACLVSLAWNNPAHAAPPPSRSIEQLVENSDFICKAIVVSTKPVDDPWFEKRKGLDVCETELKIIAVYKGEPQDRASIHHYANRGRGEFDDVLHYQLPSGRPFLVFGRKTPDEHVFRQIRKDRPGRPDQEVLMAADEDPHNGLTVKEVIWQELMGLLKSSAEADVVGAVDKLDWMSGGVSPTEPVDFRRWDVVKAVRQADERMVQRAMIRLGRTPELHSINPEVEPLILNPAPNIIGRWRGDSWGDVEIRLSSDGSKPLYVGTYTRTDATSPGQVELNWSKESSEFQGTFKSGNRSGTIALRQQPNGKTIRGSWKADANSKIEPDHSELEWVRQNATDSQQEGSIAKAMKIAKAQKNSEVNAAEDNATSKPKTRSRQIKVFTLANGNATEYAEILKPLFPGMEIVADPRTNTIIISYTGEEQSQVVEAVLLRLDENAVDARDKDPRRSAPATARQNVVIRLQDSSATEIAEAMKLLFPKDTFVADAKSNSLLVSSDPERFHDIESGVLKLDELNARRNSDSASVTFTSSTPSDTLKSDSLATAIAEYEARAKQLAEQIRKQSASLGDKHPDQAKARLELTQVLDKALSLKLQQEQQQLKQLEERLTRLRSQLQFRRANNVKIVQRRLRELLDDDHTQWNGADSASATIPGRPVGTSPQDASANLQLVDSRGEATSIHFLVPEGMRVKIPGEQKLLSFSGVHAFPRLKDQTKSYDLRFFPESNSSPRFSATLEILPAQGTLHPYATSPIPFRVTDEDLEQLASGNAVTKVTYFPFPKFQAVSSTKTETLVSTRLDPGIDPLTEARKRGEILFVARFFQESFDASNDAANRIQPASKDNKSPLDVPRSVAANENVSETTQIHFDRSAGTHILIEGEPKLTTPCVRNFQRDAGHSERYVIGFEKLPGVDWHQFAGLLDIYPADAKAAEFLNRQALSLRITRHDIEWALEGRVSTKWIYLPTNPDPNATFPLEEAGTSRVPGESDDILPAGKILAVLQFARDFQQLGVSAPKVLEEISIQNLTPNPPQQPQTGFGVPPKATTFHDLATRLAGAKGLVADARDRLKRTEALHQNNAVTTAELTKSQRDVEDAVLNQKLIEDEYAVVLREMELEIESAELTLRQEQVKLDWTEKLVKDNVVSKDELVDPQSNTQKAKLSVQRLKARYDLYKKQYDQYHQKSEEKKKEGEANNVPR